MQTTRKIHPAHWAGLLLGSTFGAVSAAPQYAITDLGHFGGTYSQGLGLNEAGQATGFAHTADNAAAHAFLWDGTQTIPLLDLGTLSDGTQAQGFDINNASEVTGSASLLGDTTYHAFRWLAAPTPPLAPLQDLGTLPGGTRSRGHAISDTGLVAGFSETADGSDHAVLWDNGTIQDLGTLDPAGTGNSQGYGVNGLGQVVGFSSVVSGTSQHAVLWTNGTPRDLGSLGGNYSAGYAINEAGQVTGYATLAGDAAQHAFVWDGTRVPPMTDLGTLAGGSFSEGYGINAAGEVVGYATASGDSVQRAFLWQNGTMQDLNTLIDPASGWTLLEAHAISDKGDITGIGTVNGERRAFLLTREGTDSTPPVIGARWTPAAPNGAAGWYTTAPSLAWSVTDPESAISARTGCDAVAAVADTIGQSFTCSATSGGGTASVTTTIKVDAARPILTVPLAISQAATDPSGAVVTYTVGASDATSLLNTTRSVSGYTCAPASGTTFAIGATTVSCSASDNAGNSNTASFVVTVADTTPPAISCPAPVRVVQGQTIVLGAATATDNVGVVSLTNNAPASYPIGTTTVTWTAVDAAANNASCSQTVTVASATTTPPPATEETLAVARSQCKRISATAGEWLVQGTSSISTNNSIQLYATANPSTTPLGVPVPVSSKGDWQFQAKPGPACTTPISLRSNSTGTAVGSVGVTIQ